MMTHTIFPHAWSFSSRKCKQKSTRYALNFVHTSGEFHQIFTINYLKIKKKKNIFSHESSQNHRRQ